MVLLNWEQIWRNKAKEIEGRELSLDTILKVNGYDVKYAETGAETIRKFVRELLGKLRLKAGDHLLEVGCGAGAIAIPMSENGIRVTGLDRCEELIAIARKALPGETFLTAEAADFDLPRKDFDAALSQGVFQFFESQDYGIRTIRNMLGHLRKGAVLAVTDLLDEATREALMEERIRLLGRKVYEEKYVSTGLTHQFYERDVISKALEGHCERCWFEDQFLDNATAGFKFNLFAIR